MKGGVGSGIFGGACQRAGLIEIGEHGPQAERDIIRTVEGHFACCQTFQHFSDRQPFEIFRQRCRHQPCAAARAKRDQSFLFEPAHGLTYGSPADPELSCKLLFAKPQGSREAGCAHPQPNFQGRIDFVSQIGPGGDRADAHEFCICIQNREVYGISMLRRSDCTGCE
jgi:hypothetical protein